MINRRKLQELSRIRIKEANALFQSGCYDGAYYIAGYAVECALKACIAKQTRRYDYPDINTVKNSYTHDLKLLIKTAGLWVQFENEISTNHNLQVNWTIVKDWSEKSRYEEHNSPEAKDLLSAITDREGVLTWIRRHW